MRQVFGFIGIKNPEFISADGIQVGPEHREKAVAGALKAAGDLNAAELRRERLRRDTDGSRQIRKCRSCAADDDQGNQKTDTGEQCN